MENMLVTLFLFRHTFRPTIFPCIVPASTDNSKEHETELCSPKIDKKLNSCAVALISKVVSQGIFVACFFQHTAFQKTDVLYATNPPHSSTTLPSAPQ